MLYANDSADFITKQTKSSIENSGGKASYNFTKIENWSTEVSNIQFIPTWYSLSPKFT